MASLDETGATGGGSGSVSDERTAPTQLELRVRQLESENAALRAELADVKAKHAFDKELLLAHSLRDMPRTKKEFDAMLAKSVPFDDVLRELEAKYGAGSGK